MRPRSRATFWRIAPAREVDDEIDAHIELQTRRYVAEGLTPDAARARAVHRFGDVARVRDECREIRHRMEVDVRLTELAHELRGDLAVAARSFARQPLFTIAALLTLAIGIGANTTVFSVVDAVLLRPLPYRHADRIVTVWNSYAGSLSRAAIAPAELADLREQTRAFDAIVGVTRQASNLSGDGEPERVSAYVVSPETFDVLGAAPALGRGFTRDDGLEESPRVVILSHALWTRRFGADPAVVGRDVTIGGIARTIVGVMPPSVRFPDAPVNFLRERGDLWIPFDWARARTEDRGNQRIAVLARLAPHATRETARRDLAAMAARFRAEYPERYAPPTVVGWRLDDVPLRDVMVGDVRPALLVIAGAVGLVLLIACVNVANLLLARGAGRAREMAVRLALGARRARIVRQLLTESGALALCGGALGTLVAWIGLRLLGRADAGSVPLLDGAGLDATTLAFSIVVSVATGLLFGILPALRHSRADVRDSLGGGARGATSGRRQGTLRAALVAIEIGMAAVVLVGAALLGRSLAALGRTPAGFAGDGALTAQLTIPARTYDSTAKVAAFFEAVVARASSVPGAREVTGVYPLPMSDDGWSGSYRTETQRDGEPEPHAEYAVSLPGYFHAMRIALREGRDFTADDRIGRTEVVVVDEALARRHWPGESAIGKRLNLTGRDDGVYATIVGVVAHVRSGGPRDDGEPQIYMPLLQRPQRILTLVVRTDGDPLSLAPSLRASVRAVDAEQPLSKVATMDDVVARAMARDRFNALLLTIFAVAALALAAIGLYGVMAYVVTQRTAEVGIRVALGGRPRDVRRLVVRQGVAIAGVGLAIGLVAAAALSRLLGTMLYGVAAHDPTTYAVIAALLLAVSLAACYVPARRATRIDPMRALRS